MIANIIAIIVVLLSFALFFVFASVPVRSTRHRKLPPLPEGSLPPAKRRPF